MYIITGGAGFIGSAMIWQLNQMGIDDILVVDNLAKTDKWKNLVNLRYEDYLHRDQFLKLIMEGDDPFDTKAVIHMGATSSTTEPDCDFLMENNYRYTQMVCRFCLTHDARFINASSAATYGDGSLGFDDDHSKIHQWRPLNMYGYSKQLFDLWALKGRVLDKLVSLKFFNVYGPNEYHKGNMRSVICKAYQQITETSTMKLFKSYHPDYEDGGQLRDFVYVKDCCDLMGWLLEHPEVNGTFNVGTGNARSWNDLARSVFKALDVEPQIHYIDMPEVLRGKYQYYTRAEMAKLRAAGYDKPFTTLEEGAKDYVQSYLAKEDPFLKS
ncbi:MAG: ADP-glyceromanno-heptose 6-epimerase [Desulfovibrio sp.]